MIVQSEMKAIIVIILSSTNVLIINAGHLSTCEIEGVDEMDWYYGKQLQEKIPDSQEGPFIHFNTKNIIGIKGQTSTYIYATYQNNVLQLHPNSKFKTFDEDYTESVSTRLEIAIDLECTQKTFETIKFIARIEDVNDNAPLFDRSVYEYNFGMTIPEDYYLTNILPISAVDKDFSNSGIYFVIEYNTILKLEYHGKRNYYDKNYFTTIKTLTEIQAPFREEFTIIAIDSGTPSRSSTAQVVIVSADISANSSKNQNGDHFIFSKNVYAAKYLHNYLQIDDPIELSCSKHLLLQQKGFEENFKIEIIGNGIVQISTLHPVSDSVRSTKSFIIIDIEATCDDFSQQAALVVTFKESFLDFITLPTFYNNSLGSLIIYIGVLIAIVINIKLLYMYFQKHHKRFSTTLPL